MRIGIIGAGSIGLLFSWYLSEKHEVTLYTRTVHQADMINRQGVALVKEAEAVRKLPAKPMDEWMGGDDLTIITVKQYQLHEVLIQIEDKLDKAGSLLFLQNGMGHLKLVEKLQASSVYVGSIEHGAVRESAVRVRHNGSGAIRAAVFKGSIVRLEELANNVPEDFSIQVETDYYDILVRKLVVNAVINPLTAAFEVQNGILLANPFYRKIAISLLEETLCVLEMADKEEHYRNVVNVCEKTASNYSSMYGDLSQGRPTEIDAILGFLMEEAEKRGVHCPYISNYYHVIKGKELQGEVVT
ncbi:2-dehydropantoate 2-reductase [Bacillus sp. FJAT-27251]|uniref:2-dehydropantoate 2-reductase n=1 Tax=Bacillus sp. FJAT-27251 TaxID=1684142 RepID=UPI0006A7CDBE|nr:2-dehydropantoate 2-reductase [Bacillus sp. FJAT-27251]